MRRNQTSILGELLTLLFLPFVRPFYRRRGTPTQIKAFYRSAEWKRVRFDVLIRQPACQLCGASRASGARLNVDHKKPLSKRWDLRLKPSNLQTLCASCNWGKGGR